MAEPITVLSGTLATVVVSVLTQFGIPMWLERTVIDPSDTGDELTRGVRYTCRGIAGEAKRRYDRQTGAMRREMEVVLTDPVMEPQAGDRIVLQSGAVVCVITPDSGITAVRPDFVTTIAYQLAVRVT